VDKILSCSFCSLTKDKVFKLVAGPMPDVYICDNCVSEAVREMTRMSRENSVAVPSGATWFCLFCGQSHEDVKCLAVGAGVYICNMCLSRSFEIMVGETRTKRVVRLGGMS
jgi:ATP-dependent protease Clp ATPase subunit